MYYDKHCGGREQGVIKIMEGERHDLKKEMANSFSEAIYNLKYKEIFLVKRRGGGPGGAGDAYAKALRQELLRSWRDCVD